MFTKYNKDVECTGFYVPFDWGSGSEGMTEVFGLVFEGLCLCSLTFGVFENEQNFEMMIVSLNM